jgi:extradiol dioxygenase
MRIQSLGYVGVESPKYKEWETFGPEVCGMELAQPGVDGTVRLRMDDRHHRFAIHPGAQNRLSYIGWELRDVHEWEDAVEELRSADVTVEVGNEELADTRRVQGVAVFHDLYGFQHELFYGQSRWRNSFVPGRRHDGFVAGYLGMGHIVLAVPEILDTHRHFYTDTMGFRIFLTHPLPRGGRAIHYRGVAPRTNCFATFKLGGGLGIHHIFVETKELDDVGRAYDLVQARGIPLWATLGRHSPDPVISFYCYTPSGFILEYGTGCELIDETWVQGRSDPPSEIWGHRILETGAPAIESSDETLPDTVQRVASVTR